MYLSLELGAVKSGDLKGHPRHLLNRDHGQKDLHEGWEYRVAGEMALKPEKSRVKAKGLLRPARLTGFNAAQGRSPYRLFQDIAHPSTASFTAPARSIPFSEAR